MTTAVALDGSALFAILKGESGADACREALRAADHVLVSAGSLAEMLIVASRRGLLAELEHMIELVRPEVVPLTAARARAAAAAYRRWGKSFHDAKLNICDSFAYVLAEEIRCPLLFVGSDFAQTDFVSALDRSSPH